MTGVADALRASLVPARPDPALPSGVPAAVLIPLLDLPEPTVLLTKRTDTVRTHKGEISFPGGARHPEDVDLLDTALRETEEELGIKAGAVEVLGALPPTDTVVTGYVIVPYVGLLRERPDLRPSAVEIAEVVEAGVSHLAAVERADGGPDPTGAMRTWFTYEVVGHIVWGATGRIVHALLEALRAGGWAPQGR